MECWHMSGAGNDFMVIDARGLQIDFEEYAKKLCALSGADGFMAIDYSKVADFRLHFYNSDGSRGEMCGNGSRCICRFAYDHKLVNNEMAVETDAGIVYGKRINETQYQVMLNTPGILDLTRTENAAYVELGNPGVPHAVIEIPDLTWDMKEELLPLSLKLRFHPAFPKGANVNFYTWIGPDRLRVLTFERGVEDYTLACGTGCGSISCVLFAKGLLPFGDIITENEGGTLSYHIEGKGTDITSVQMQGPTEIVQVYEI